MTVMERLKARRREAVLLFIAAIFVAVTLVNLEMSSNTGFDLHLGQVMGGFVAVCLLAHLALCWLVPLADQILLPVVAGLNGLGLIMIYRLDLDNGSSMASRQVMWSLIGVVLMILTLVVLKDHRSLSKYSYILGLVGLILLALPMVWPVKVNADANIWISIGSFSIQPSEFSKILLLLFFAQLLVTKRALFTVAGYRFLGMEFPRLRDLGPILAVWFVALLIMAGENDFGPALLLFGTVLGMIYLTTGRASWLLIGVFLVAIGGTAIYQVSAKIQARVENFIDPVSNYHGSGYQLSQALFGMSWGGITGTGLGQGYPYTVPVAHSDFILAAIGEELGLVGLAGVLILFAIFIQRGMHTALIIKDSYGKLVASGLALTMAIQIFVVVGGISALMPMSGLTTPFMSQGGSSLMANYILVGIILRISNTAHKEMAA
ncbi:MAG: FtsW/RodA/SpoVE family cell cycle protein [Corynebacterium sp.]|nr:FtsW/RodA/SpoVE family cell cycle protein [Corynebacterium sp.]